MITNTTRGNTLLAVSPVDRVIPILRSLRDSTRRKLSRPKNTQKGSDRQPPRAARLCRANEVFL